MVLGPGDILTAEALPDSVCRQRPPAALDLDLPPEGLDLEATLDELEKKLLRVALTRTNGVQTRAAELLGMTFRQFRYKLQKHGLSRGSSADHEE